MDTGRTSEEDNVVQASTHSQVTYFQKASPRCRALQLPEGVLLRYNLSSALYFYLRTEVVEGKIRTRVFASDSPYDRIKTEIGEVTTPMFEPNADKTQLTKLEQLLRTWVNFVKDEPDLETPFSSFPINEHHD